MSEEKDSNEAMKYHVFGPPRSLQDMENADVLWKMITKRFPNAAPLLCEMEAVIDRADDLLRQLRTPCVKSADRSSLKHFTNSLDSDEVVSLICDESFLADTDVFEDVVVTRNIIETGSTISTDETDFDSIEKSDNSRDELNYKEHHNGKNNGKIIDFVRGHSPTKMNEKTSLESWGRLVDNETESVDTQLDTRHLIKEEKMLKQVEPPTESRRTLVKKVFGRTQESEIKKSSGDWEVNAKENNSSMHDLFKNKETLEDSSKTVYNEISSNNNIRREINCKTPWKILEEYAKGCNVKIEYHCEKNKCNHYVITGKLLEFSATGCGDNEELTKNSIAKRILQNVVDHQMNNKEMKQLLELSRDQILEILHFDDDETIETPLRKVYMLCMNKGAPPPKYITEVEYKHQGVKCVAKCIALDHVAEGHGVSRYNAKKAAAEQFYRKYGNKKTF